MTIASFVDSLRLPHLRRDLRLICVYKSSDSIRFLLWAHVKNRVSYRRLYNQRGWLNMHWAHVNLRGCSASLLLSTSQTWQRSGVVPSNRSAAVAGRRAGECLSLIAYCRAPAATSAVRWPLPCAHPVTPAYSNADLRLPSTRVVVLVVFEVSALWIFYLYVLPAECIQQVNLTHDDQWRCYRYKSHRC